MSLVPLSGVTVPLPTISVSTSPTDGRQVVVRGEWNQSLCGACKEHPPGDTLSCHTCKPIHSFIH
jgi:hypothetical protein